MEYFLLIVLQINFVIKLIAKQIAINNTQGVDKHCKDIQMIDPDIWTSQRRNNIHQCYKSKTTW